MTLIAAPSAARAGRRHPATAPVPAPADAAEEPPSSPGWYESSWDLRQGLEVREGPWPEGMLLSWGLAA